MSRLLAALLLALTVPAQAQFLDGNGLLERMNDQGTVKPMVALGFVLGVADSFRGTEVCLPENVQARQLYDVVHQWLRANPDKRHLEGAAIVLVALNRTWPCQKADLSRGSKM